MGAAARRHPVRLAVAISALLSVVYLLSPPQTLDLSAQQFRADLWDTNGWVVWSDAWYGGFTVPGYSLVYPPLGALLGPELVGAISAIAAAALFATIAEGAVGERAWLGSAWFGAASTLAAFGGRSTFAVGIALGLGALLALQRRRLLPAALAALVAGLASPVAGAFTALAAAALALAHRFGLGAPADRSLPGGRAVVVAASAGIGVAVLALGFPTDGYQPFGLSSWIWIPVVCLGALALVPRQWPALRWAALLYLALGVAALELRTPLGGNAVRLGATFAGPVLALVLYQRRPRALALLALPLLWWQCTATVRDVVAAAGDPSTSAAYFTPLVQELENRTKAEPVRVEVLPTRNRWESVYVAEHIPIARGWLRQLESDDFPLFDGGRLTPARYASWLSDHGIAYVALPDAGLDYISKEEAAIISSGLPYLHEVWSNSNWQLWRVGEEGSNPLASGGAVVTGQGPDRFTVTVPGPGSYELRFRWTPYFEVEGAAACVSDGGRGGTKLDVTGARAGETIEISAGLSLAGALRRDRSCSG